MLFFGIRSLLLRLGHCPEPDLGVVERHAAFGNWLLLLFLCREVNLVAVAVRDDSGEEPEPCYCVFLSLNPALV
jgi:hypothetical protein